MAITPHSGLKSATEKVRLKKYSMDSIEGGVSRFRVLSMGRNFSLQRWELKYFAALLLSERDKTLEGILDFRGEESSVQGLAGLGEGTKLFGENWSDELEPDAVGDSDDVKPEAIDKRQNLAEFDTDLCVHCSKVPLDWKEPSESSENGLENFIVCTCSRYKFSFAVALL